MIVDFGLRALRKKRDSNTTYNTPRQDKPLLMFNVSHDEEKPAQSSMMRADCDEQVFVRCVQIRGGDSRCYAYADRTSEQAAITGNME